MKLGNKIKANQAKITKIARGATDVMQGFSDSVSTLKSTLFFRTAYKSSIVLGLGVSEHESSGKAAAEMRALCKDIMKRGRS